MSAVEADAPTAGDLAPSILPSLPSVIWQRRWFLIVPLVLTVIAGFATAILMRPVYESVATVLIESPQLPADLVSSPVTDIIEQRIARTRERVLSRMDLIRLIRADDLYPREQRTMALSKIVDRMKDDTILAAVSADLQGGKGTRSGAPDTIAIQIGFRYSDPIKAQQIAQQYVNRFLELDAATQADQATGAFTFLNDQANSIQSQISAIANKINDIKAKHGAAFAIGSQMTGDPTADAARIDADIAGLETQNTQLLRTPPDTGNGVLAAEQALRAAEARYSDTHPDVIAAKAQLAAAQRDAAQTGGFNASKAQAATNQQQIAALRSARASILSQSSVARSAQSQVPVLNAQVDQLEKQGDSLRDQYRDIGIKLQNAQVSARMQSEQKGERLVLADPPVVPDRPSQPNRPVIIVGSIAAGLGIGLGLILLVELMLRPLRGTEAVTFAIGEAPLVVIPDFAHKPNPIIRFVEARRRRRMPPVRAANAPG